MPSNNSNKATTARDRLRAKLDARRRGQGRAAAAVQVDGATTMVNVMKGEQAHEMSLDDFYKAIKAGVFEEI